MSECVKEFKETVNYILVRYDLYKSKRLDRLTDNRSFLCEEMCRHPRPYDTKFTKSMKKS